MSRLVQNTGLKTVSGDRVFSSEPYAQELYDLIVGNLPSDWEPTLKAGELYKCKVESIQLIDENVFDLWVNAPSGETYKIDGFNGDLVSNLFPGDSIEVLFIERNGQLIPNIEEASKIKTMKEISKCFTEEHCAFTGKIVGKNDGGFWVDINGNRCYLPGSLAAANRVWNFESMLGKTVNVMPDSYIEKTGTWVVSVKKWINKVLPAYTSALSVGDPIVGTITGTGKAGIFIEWNDMFTGLVTNANIPSERKEDWMTYYKSQTQITVWISEIRGNRIFLTLNEPKEKSEK